MIKILFLLMPLICLLGCETNNPFNIPEYEHVKAFNRMIAPFVEDMQKTENLYPTIVSGQLMDKVNTVSLRFQSHKALSLEESRALYIHCTQKLLDHVNSNEEIKPYLVTYPFTQNEIEVALSFYKPKSYERVEPPQIAYVFMSKGEICYCIHTGATDTNPLETVHEETYAEALKIVKDGKTLKEQ